MVLGSMLLGGALVAGGAVLYRALSGHYDSTVYVSSPSVDPAKYNRLRSEMNAVQQSLGLSNKVLADMLFALVEQDPRKSLETLVKGAGFAPVQPLLLDASGVEIFGTQEGSAGEPILITFNEFGERVYGVGAEIGYHGEFFVPEGASGDKEIHVMDYNGLIVLESLNLPVSGMLALPEPRRKNRVSDGYILEEGCRGNLKDAFAYVSDEEARQTAQNAASLQFLEFQRYAKSDERMLVQTLENALNKQLGIVPIAERKPQHRGPEATAYLRDRLQKRLTPPSKE